MRLDRVAERKVCVHLVAIPPALAYPREIAPLTQLSDDSLRRTLRDPHPLRHLAQANPWLTCDAQEHVGVIA